MSFKRFIAPLALCLALPLTSFASETGEEAAALFDSGLVVLAKGNFDGALEAFTGAAKSDPANENYRQHVILVRRVMQLRGQLEKKKDPKEWAQLAQSLRSFYTNFDVYGEALALDTKRHAKLCTPGTAVDLAESQLELSKNAEAVKVLSSLGKKTPPRGKLMLGIALARTGDLDGARKIAKTNGIPVTDDPKQIFDAACLNALVGNTAMAANQLTLVFEKTPPGKLERVKNYAKRRPDLAGLKGAQYEKVWLVASKVKAAGCGGCSKEGTGACSSGAGAAGGCSDKDKEDGCSDEKEAGGDCCDKDKK